MATETTLESTSPVHLLVLVHGMWGNTSHLAEMARIAKETFSSTMQESPDQVHLLLAEANNEEGTYDGIDWCAERVVEEIIKEVHRLQTEERRPVRKFSITGYSLGGLVSRYVVGILAQRGFFTASTFGSELDPTNISMLPMNFNMIATPNLGLVRYPTLFSSLAHTLGPKLLSRTGEQFYLKDKWSSNGRPLLDILSDPSLVFFQALAQFKKVRIFANAVNDNTVPYVTAAIEEEDPFVDWNLDDGGVDVEFHPTYRPIITSFVRSSPNQPTQPRKKKTKRSSKPLLALPPILVRPFPWNILIYLLLPLLIPLLFIVVFVKFSRATSRSRKRIRLLEKSETGEKSLVSLVGARLKEGVDYIERMEKRIEDAVADMVDDPRPVAISGSESESTSGTSTPSASVSYGTISSSSSAGSNFSTSTSATSVSSRSSPASKRTLAPSLTPLQRTICARLNSIPGLRKELAFIDSMDPIDSTTPRRSIRNSHATIVSRDVKNYEFHRIGEGVLRCWAEGLIV
ncbi:hypothetical protein GYMLUDRAFT_42778 [Collybiopsis luxurians FD-317 M1]|uniref:DUF676 domain-containing protein n=1 Tax=Collybiopsis luxurians FD-317 M1 TaxID=944289 RepID=A0A0D0C0M1_9AGAR|nr:hypothetical protein GYMLUDRAFT_42778 [Collybiopsis luxurians FD-317 M1]